MISACPAMPFARTFLRPEPTTPDDFSTTPAITNGTRTETTMMIQTDEPMVTPRWFQSEVHQKVRSGTRPATSVKPADDRRKVLPRKLPEFPVLLGAAVGQSFCRGA